MTPVIPRKRNRVALLQVRLTTGELAALRKRAQKLTYGSLSALVRHALGLQVP